MNKTLRGAVGLLIAAVLLTAPGCGELTEPAARAALSGTSASFSEAPVSETGENGTVECLFPRAGQDAQKKLIQIIGSAEKTLDMAIYSFTDANIADAVVACSRRGVTVRVITDKTQSGGAYQKKILQRLKKEKIPIKMDSHSGIMHLKITIADEKVATTGSYNYTKSADEENDEVFVVLRSEETARQFEQEFEDMWTDKKRFTNYS